MTRYVQKPSGQMAGSIGDGRDAVPTPASSSPVTATPTRETAPSMADVMANLLHPDPQQLRTNIEAAAHGMRSAGWVIDALDEYGQVNYWTGRADAYDRIAGSGALSPALLEVATEDQLQASRQAYNDLAEAWNNQGPDLLTELRNEYVVDPDVVADIIGAARGLSTDQTAVLALALPSFDGSDLRDQVTKVCDDVAVMTPPVRETTMVLMRDGMTYAQARDAAQLLLAN